MNRQRLASSANTAARKAGAAAGKAAATAPTWAPAFGLAGAVLLAEAALLERLTRPLAARPVPRLALAMALGSVLMEASNRSERKRRSRARAQTMIDEAGQSIALEFPDDLLAEFLNPASPAALNPVKRAWLAGEILRFHRGRRSYSEPVLKLAQAVAAA